MWWCGLASSPTATLNINQRRKRKRKSRLFPAACRRCQSVGWENLFSIASLSCDRVALVKAQIRAVLMSQTFNWRHKPSASRHLCCHLRGCSNTHVPSVTSRGRYCPLLQPCSTELCVFKKWHTLNEELWSFRSVGYAQQNDLRTANVTVATWRMTAAAMS